MTFRYALIPGRHQALTVFQSTYLMELISKNSGMEIIWAITSANHSNTRRNPLSGERRLGMVEAFAAQTGLRSQVYLINNMEPKPNFAHYLLEDIRLQSRGDLDLSPDNTVVVCSTPSVIEMYQKLGFKIAPAELDEKSGSIIVSRPWDVVEGIINNPLDWRKQDIVQTQLHPACLAYYDRYHLAESILEVFDDSLIDSADGDITTTRDYATYRKAFEDNAWRKVVDIIDYVEPGRILDVGCATGQTLKLLAEKPMLFESDFYGVEAARPLYQICEQRKSNGEFGNANMFFYQRNIMQSTLFKRNSFNTVITMALTHEIESYLGREALVEFVKRMYDMLAPGGVYINYDVVGPEDKDVEVYALLRTDDGENPTSINTDLVGKELAMYLEKLSTKARFMQFANDFRAEEDDRLSYRLETVNKQEYIVLRRADLYDFIAKKDYTDSWKSEMHERFCFFEHSDWLALLQDVGFSIEPASEAKQNPWLIENRFKPAGQVYALQDKESLVLQDQPATNTLLIARKPQ